MIKVLSSKGFAVVQLIKRTDSGFWYSNNSGYQLNREVLVRDEISAYQYVSSGVILIELRQAVSPFDTLAKLHWNAATGKVELVTTSGTTVVWAAPQSGSVRPPAPPQPAPSVVHSLRAPPLIGLKSINEKPLY